MKIEITPVVVVPDMSPLIHRASVGLLEPLQEFGRVVVMDIVAYEASAEETKPWAREVSAWLAEGGRAGGNQPVEIVKTEIGEAYRLARRRTQSFDCKTPGKARYAIGWLTHCRRSAALPW